MGYPYWLLLLVLGGLCLACTRTPAFSSETTVGVNLEAFQSIALDPRKDMVLMVDGQRLVDPGVYREEVLRQVEGKGYKLVDSESADLWVEVFAMVPAKGGWSGVAPGGGHGEGMRGGGHRSGGMSRGGMERGGMSDLGERGSGSNEGKLGKHSGEEFYPGMSGEMSLMVKLVNKSSLQTVWFGSAYFPALAKGKAPTLDDTTEGRIRKLLELCPARSGTKQSV